MESLGESSPSSHGRNGLTDNTSAFTKNDSAEITLQEAGNPEKTLINGNEAYWIRITIVQGNYEKEATYIQNGVKALRLDQLLFLFP